MTQQSPSIEEWRRLYDVAARVKDLAPWDWMDEIDLFAVEDPESGELGFVSIMGQGGEHFAVAAYLGLEGLAGFWTMEELGSDASPQLFLSIPQLQVSFEDRNQLRDEDRATIKALGLRFRGRNAWPHFRSYRPGFLPWFLEAPEARFLTHVLEQVLDVAPRLRDDKSLVYHDHSVMVRTPSRTGDGLVWRDQQRQIPSSQELDIEFLMDTKVLDRLRALPRQRVTVEVDLFMLPSPVREGKDRPAFPYLLLLVDGKYGFVLGFEMMLVERSLPDLWARIPLAVAHKLVEADLRPRTIKTRSGLLPVLLQHLADELGIRLKHSTRLTMLDPAMEEFLRFTS